MGVIFLDLKASGLKLKPKKSQLFKKGPISRSHGEWSRHRNRPREDPGTGRSWLSNPLTVKEVKCFLGLCSYYGRFVPDFSQPSLWLNSQKRTRVYLVRRAAEVLGGTQEKNNHNRNRRCLVSKYPQRRICYCIWQVEKKFTLQTNDASLWRLKSFKHSEGQVARWLETLDAYDYELIHRPGGKHLDADALSRGPCVGNRVCNAVEIMWERKFILEEERILM